MKIKHLLLIPAATSAFAVAAPAHAETLIFDFVGNNGVRSFNFMLEQGQTPDSSSTFSGANRVNFNNLAGTFTGAGGTTNVASNVNFGSSFFAPIIVNATGFGPGIFSGPDLFNGSRTTPIFNLGIFQLNQTTGVGGTLTISQVQAAVPEPATWAMMILGFGIIGFGLRRRKQNVNVNYAFA